MNKMIAEDSLQEQSQADTRLKREKQIKRLIKKYEETIFSFFRELKVPLQCRELLRAYIIASNGETNFEASHTYLTNLLYKKSFVDFDSNRDKVRYSISKLQKWQRKKKIDLIRVIKEGRRLNLPDGGYEYLKSQYEFVLLDELVKVLYDSSSNLEARIKEAVEKMKQAYVPADDKRKIPTHLMLERCRKTVFTKFGRALEQAKEINLNPIEYGGKLIAELQATFDEIKSQYTEKQNRERRIYEFMGAANASEIDSYENKGVEKHHINSLENLGGNIPSYNRTFSLSMDRDNDIDNANTFLNSATRENESNNPLLSAALNYAKAGYYVVPLHTIVNENNFVRCSCSKWQTCVRQGKHPRTWHGLLDASNDSETIKNWWSKWPNANVGLITGKKSGILVLDIDLNKGGEHSLNDLQDSYGGLSPTLTAISGSGGRHLIFKYPSDVKVKNSVSLIAPGLDIKSDNGYIVAAPSSHISGGRYQWHGLNTPILDAPDWLIALILLAEEEAKQDKKVENIKFDYSTALVSTETIREEQEFKTASGKSRGRHDYLFRYASGLVLSHSPEQVLARTQARNLARCVPPLDYEDMAKQVESAERYRGNQNQKAA
jgi:hypothetical protein